MSLPFLTSALDEGVFIFCPCPCRFTSRERVPGTNWIGGWVDHRPGLFLSLPGIESQPSSPRCVDSMYPVGQAPSSAPPDTHLHEVSSRDEWNLLLYEIQFLVSESSRGEPR
jgi:hypothetical protein